MLRKLNLAGCSSIIAVEGVSAFMDADKLRAALMGVLDSQEWYADYQPRLLLCAVPVGHIPSAVVLKSLGGYVVENTASAHNQKGINLWIIPGIKGGILHNRQLNEGFIERVAPNELSKFQKERIEYFKKEQRNAEGLRLRKPQKRVRKSPRSRKIHLSR